MINRFRNGIKIPFLGVAPVRSIAPTGSTTQFLTTRESSSTTAQTTTVDPEVFMHTESVVLPITTNLKIVDTTTMAKWPVFRIVDPQGQMLNKDLDPKFSKEEAIKMYQTMIRIQCLDDVFYNAQRQGRISFYMQSSGEEAIHIGKKGF